MRSLSGMLALLVGLAAPAATQTPGDTLRLTLDASVQRALERNARIRVAQASVQDANGQVRQATATALPQVTGSVVYTRQFSSIYQGLGGNGGDSLANLFKNTPFGAANAWNFQLQANQLIWSGGKVGAALGAAKAFRQVASLQQAQTAADITFQVKQAYWNAAFQYRVLTIAIANLDQARQHLHEVQLFRNAGTRAEYDLLRAQVDASNQEPPVVQARNDLGVAMLDLKRMLDVPADVTLLLDTSLERVNESIPVLATDSVGAISRAGLEAAEATVREQEELVRVARADRWPTVSVATTYTQQTFPQDGSPFGSQYVNGWNGEVRVSIPILQFKTAGAVQSANAALLRAQAERDVQKRQVELEVVQAQGELERAQKLLVARRLTVNQAQRAQYLAGVRYTNGMATQLDVTDARVAASQAEVNEVQATRDYLVALAELEHALGHPVPVVERSIEQIAGIPNVKESEP